ncbi:MAG: hypothetical protein ACYCOU_15765 [Sulfobacillus sp.]
MADTEPKPEPDSKPDSKPNICRTIKLPRSTKTEVLFPDLRRSWKIPHKVTFNQTEIEVELGFNGKTCRYLPSYFQVFRTIELPIDAGEFKLNITNKDMREISLKIEVQYHNYAGELLFQGAFKDVGITDMLQNLIGQVSKLIIKGDAPLGRIVLRCVWDNWLPDLDFTAEGNSAELDLSLGSYEFVQRNLHLFRIDFTGEVKQVHLLIYGMK